ncbi:UDP-2,3-diacylglucosamine diphosphatase [Vibrio aestuarianus]|uniref:UDP-2,3-diacylglucosamine hydrolase n=1 Tax=Vibrio aestuarianus TaxID=28171 RepID=A0ABM9FRZ9_9VIBR|nr:UDP-2,3-diacylglucosamine diphosphatase [Vibrio aestuarianus]MDE1213741.1 UDP-2,3-diacylglucosamine diphosphatase [Vibrio aestuarianus]MDE1217197.1 UDP-2,3-diacylglucosamine diphosphatase [Vibrio aestuarianus]MDE1228089.1 UDP-2,3-diacylglucosamine diphosphatase [Vibrio aestuarianus]MDE1256937.1 UDP-2,3-diacylglucosamine diphosphatase [Vibrio aestuarianus]MDE1260738.1 UDP-2,3-diacylglucosamine diphosphatase [Vibrio aestuarianus]
MHTLFISDLHLSPFRHDITNCFVRFMREEAIYADALYVLGDLFEFWIGDDDGSPFADQIKAEFSRLTGRGIPCYFTQGNRDFLLGKRFAKETGIILLDEEHVINLYGTKAVVLHGDTLCTQDIKYQQYRKKVHQPWLQWIFNRLPFSLKMRIVGKVQSDINSDKQMKSLDIMDVTLSEVDHVLRKHNVDLMIHGHTHRPDVHHTKQLNKETTRIVLGDWYTQGSVLVYADNGFKLETRQFKSDS